MLQVAKYYRLLFFMSIFFVLNSCLSAGTHGSIKGYRYALSKSTLEKYVWKVIDSSAKIRLDTLRNYDGSINYYNDRTNYITINILDSSLVYKFVFRFYGDSVYWDTSKTSAIFIAYATKNGFGGSEGHNDFTGEKRKLEKELIEVFENEFIEKLEIEIGFKHQLESD